MSVRYVQWEDEGGEPCAIQIARVLQDLRYELDIRFYVNEAHRTIARQKELIREKGLWSPSNPTGAAPANDNAPHIWTGRINHALDIVAFKGARGGVPEAFLAGLRKLGIRYTLPILTEPWHIVLNLEDLLAYSARRRRATRALRRKVRKAKRKLRAQKARVGGLVKRLRGRRWS